MAAVKPMRVILSPDRTFARMRIEHWSQDVPISDLPEQLRFYRSLAAKRPDPYAQRVEAIEAAMKRADIQENGHG